ncbi:MAG: tandem-95 repeat protein [Flavobacteriia bacterium]|nr:tandem-95 repeat protein [Flavobacteriia bacterium]
MKISFQNLLLVFFLFNVSAGLYGKYDSRKEIDELTVHHLNFDIPDFISNSSDFEIRSGSSSQSNLLTATLFITVPDINQAPAGETIHGNVLTNDSGNGALTVTAATYLDENDDEQPLTLGTATEIYDGNGNKAGALTLNADGSYIFVSESGFNGNVQISYSAEDEDGAIGNTTLTIRVIEDLAPNGNNPPITNDDTAFTIENVVIDEKATVLNNDSDPDGDPIRVSEIQIYQSDGTLLIRAISAGSDSGNVAVYDETGNYYGQLVMYATGYFYFNPASGFIGEVAPIHYTIVDDRGGSDSAYLNITVIGDDGTNHTFANDDANSAAQGETMNGNVLLNDTDPDTGDTQSVTAIVINGVSYPVDQGGADTTVTTAEGTFTIDKDGNYTFVPDPDFTGTLIVEMTVCDSQAAPDTACDNSSLYLTSLPFDSLGMHAVLDINQTQMDIPVNGNVLTNDYGVGLTVIGATYLDASGNEQPLTLGTATEVYDQNGHKAGTLTLNADGSYTIVPEEGYIGDVPVSYTVENEDGITAEALLTIQVIQPLNPEENDPPIAHDDTAYTLEGVPVGGTVINNDSDPDGDNSNLRAIEVVLLDDTGSPHSYTVNAGSDTGLIPVYDEDPLNPGNYIQIGIFSMDDKGGFLFTPFTGYTGEVPPISYTITDGNFEYATAVLYITVLGDDGNNFTFANDDANSGIQGETMDGNVLTNDSDPEGDTQTVSSIVINGTAYPVNPDGSQTTVTTTEGTFTIDKDGNYTFEPDPDFTGTLVVEINVCDDADPQACDTSTLYLTSFSNETTCYENVNGEDFSWSYPSGTPSPVVETFTQPGTNGGFVLDLFALDNSFNMNINGIQLATQEIEFQQAGTLGQNIRFVDGTIWEQGGIPAIWQLIGTPEKPIVRVIIDKNGNVTMYGSKSSGGDLMKLELFDGNTFNTVNWNQATNNTIEVTQTVVGLTLMAGTGYGRNIIDCACYKPGVFAAGAGLPTNVGISSLRIDNSDGWPQVREGGWIALEAKTKGFVPNRLTAAQIALIPSGDLVVGMMVYNITEDCLQINVDATAGGWKCFSEQGCLD